MKNIKRMEILLTLKLSCCNIITHHTNDISIGTKDNREEPKAASLTQFKVYAEKCFITSVGESYF